MKNRTLIGIICIILAVAISFITCERFGIEPQLIQAKELFRDTEPKEIRKQLSNIRTEANTMSMSIHKAIDAKLKNKDAR